MSAQAGETLVVSLFGKPRLAHGSGPLHLAVAKSTFTLFAYLMLHRDAGHARDDLAFTLWPDEPEAQARANLRRHVYLLTRALPAAPIPWLIADSRRVGWNRDAPLSLDVERFDALAREPAARVTALDLYVGDLLVDFDAEWIEPRRNAYRAQFCDAALAAARAAIDEGGGARAVALAQRVIDVDPWREDAVRAVMLARLGAGDRAGALATYLEFERRLRAEIDTTPMAETQAVYDSIVAGTAGSRAVGASRTALPGSLTRFIGRERDVASIAAALSANRLVTLIGAGGVGKSRLAIAAADAARTHFAGEVDFVELASVGNDDRAFRAKLREAFGLAPGDEDVVDVLARSFGSRRRLVVLDNAEHLVATLGRFLVALLSRCSQIVVLVTSRQPTHIAGEQLVAVHPLQAPEREMSLPEALETESVRLFTDRARALDANFSLSLREAPSVVAICRRLDGIPLAIELAAARTTVLSAKEIDARLSRRFTLLKSSALESLPHHQTLRATLDWSYELLADNERRLFRRLGVFRSGWTLEAAAALAALDGLDEVDALDVLTRLIDQSLVVVASTFEVRRYDFLETIREYALLRAGEAGDLEASFAAAGSYFTDFVEAKAVHVGTKYEKAAYDAFASEHENLLATIDDAIARGDAERAARLCRSLASFWVVRGYVMEAQQRVESLLGSAAAIDATVQAELRTIAALLHHRCGEIARAMTRATEALAMLEGTQERRLIAEALTTQARCRFIKEELDAARALLERALELYETEGDRRGVARTLNFLGVIAAERADPQAADAFYGRSLEIFEACGDLHNVAFVFYHAGYHAYATGDYVASIEASTRALEIWHAYGNVQAENWAQHNVACAETELGHRDRAIDRHLACLETAHRRGFVRDVLNSLQRLICLIGDDEPELAARAMGYADDLRVRHGYAIFANDRARYAATVRRVEERLGPTAFAEAFAGGRRSDEEALVAALSRAATRRPDSRSVLVSQP